MVFHALLTVLQAKRRHAGGIHVSSGEQQGFVADLLAQEVAELLGQAQEHCRQVERTIDQDAFVVTIHGTVLRLTTAHFTREYLEAVESKALPFPQQLHVRRSKRYQLKTMDGRLEALRLCVGLLDYLWSGQAAVGLVQRIHGQSTR